MLLPAVSSVSRVFRPNCVRSLHQPDAHALTPAEVLGSGAAAGARILQCVLCGGVSAQKKVVAAEEKGR